VGGDWSLRVGGFSARGPARTKGARSVSGYHPRTVGRNARRRAEKKAAAKVPGHQHASRLDPTLRRDERERPLPHVHSYLTLSEYLGKWLTSQQDTYPSAEFIPQLLRQHRRDHLLVELAFLNHTLRHPGLQKRLISEYRERLAHEARGPFDELMSDQERVFVGRQAILRAMRRVLLEGTDTPNSTPKQLSIDAAIWLVQAVAEDLGDDIVRRKGSELWPGMQGPLAMELIQNYDFNGQEDIWSRLTRYGVLWDSHLHAVARTPLRASPNDLFLEATKVDRRDLFAVAFALWSIANDWDPAKPYRFDLFGALRMPREAVDRCLSLFALDTVGMTNALRDQTGDWQMLPFEEWPVLRLDDSSVILLDESFLLDRVSSGLYWYVLGYEQKDEKLASTWSTAYGAMVESYAEDRIRALATQHNDFFTEEQIKSAYGGRQSDAVLDLGEFLFFEIQKGQLSLPTRQQGAIEKFREDTDHLVLDKAAQLEPAALNIFDNETPLTGKPPRPKPKGRPVIVSGGGYPVNPITSEYIVYTASQRNLLKDPRFEQLCVIDLGELEMLEAVYERTAQSAAAVLSEWKSGGGHRYSLRTHFLERRTADPDQYRPKWMLEAGRAVFEDVESRLKLKP
jgi:hypothetical protein